MFSNNILNLHVQYTEQFDIVIRDIFTEFFCRRVPSLYFVMLIHSSPLWYSDCINGHRYVVICVSHSTFQLL